MLDANLTGQLRTYLGNIREPIELVSSLGDDAKSRELGELLDEIAALSDQIAVVRGDDDVRRPSFLIRRTGTDIGVRFAGIPMGHEFTSLVLALLQVVDPQRAPTTGTYIVFAIIKLLVLFTVLLVTVAMITLMERKVAAWIQDRIGPNRVGPFGLIQPLVDGAKMLLKDRGIPYEEIDVTGDHAKRDWLVQATGRRTVPQIFIGDEAIGGFDDLRALDVSGELKTKLAS